MGQNSGMQLGLQVVGFGVGWWVWLVDEVVMQGFYG